MVSLQPVTCPRVACARRRAHEVVDWIADYYEGLPTREPVLSQVSPGSIMAQLPRECPEEGEAWDAVMSDLDAIIMPGEATAERRSYSLR